MSIVDQWLEMDDSHKETVTIPEWGNAKVSVWSMRAPERADLEKKWATNGKSATADPLAFRSDVLSKSLRDENGELWTDQQIGKLMGKSAMVVERLFEAACRVGGFTKKDVEELEKN